MPSTLPSDVEPTPHEFLLSNFSKFTNAFSALHVNAQSLLSHFHEFNQIVANLSCCALCVSESWLKPTLSSNLVELPGYVLLRNDRTGKGGGGVAIYIRDDIPSKILAISEPKYSKRPEFLLVELSVHNIKILLCVVYRPPKAGYITELEENLHYFLPNYRHSLIMGDFNANFMPHISSFESQTLRDMFQSMGLNALPLNPTYHTSTSESLLDLIVVPDINQVLNFGQVSVPGISNHDLVFITLQILNPKPQSLVIRRRNFRALDDSTFIQDASLVPWHEINHCPSINEKVNLFNHLLISLYDRHAPFRNIRVKRKPNPWMNDDIRFLMSQRDTAYRKFKKNKSVELSEKFKKLRNKTNQAIRNAKIRYAYSAFSSHNASKVWAHVKEIGLVKRKTNNSQLSVPLNTLNKYFVSCGNLIPS
jgi:hypothetical protein